jgi:heparin binding hemagglutinin HbhA
MIAMAGPQPTPVDVPKAREQAATSAAGPVEGARTPLFAVLGAGDAAVAGVSRAVAAARTRAAERRGVAQQRAADLGGLRDKLSMEELRKLVEELRAHAGRTYAGFANRGEQTWDRIRTQPQVRQALATIEGYTEKLDARVDHLVDDAHGAAEKAKTAVSRQTKLAGDRVARVTHRATGKAAGTIDEASSSAGEAVADAGTKTAEAVAEAGNGAADTARSAAREAAAKVEPEAASRRSGVRNTAAADATTESDS